MSVVRNAKGLFVACAVAAAVCVPAFGTPFAASVVSYRPGSNVPVGYDSPLAALGAPSVDTAAWPSGREPVTPFTSAWEPSQVVTIGAGGELVVAFDHDVKNNPGNPFGIDLIVFGNAFFFDMDWPNGWTGPSAMAHFEPARIAVSLDGILWREIVGLAVDALFPTDGAGDPLRPVDPSLGLSDFDNKTLAEIRALYAGSAGGTGIDIGQVGLDAIRYVKVWQDAGDDWTTDIDAFAAVRADIPEPATWLLVGAGGLFAVLRRRRRSCRRTGDSFAGR